MDTTLFATKSNLISAKNTLQLSMQGYDLLDKKRTILINEMMSLIQSAEELQSKIDTTFQKAYAALQTANIAMGISNVRQSSKAVPVEDDIIIRFRSVMGVEIPEVIDPENEMSPSYGFMHTVSVVDQAHNHFIDVRKLTVKLAEIEISVYRLAINIKKAQKMANALKNVIIPKYQDIVATIQSVLEEKEREEFTRLKVIKRNKEKAGR